MTLFVLIDDLSIVMNCFFVFFFQAEDGIRDLVRSRGLGDVYKRQAPRGAMVPILMPGFTDAKQWSRLGAKCYGFMPTLSLIHI